ncbi:helix-turn-helix transcriptional regulator [Kineococcus endophyticus]|uniref:Helix-turn-helix transcriptional regulator n=1 Tax=Kineococcus endophyticus TaxID=1181883 RepID=A0ABV3PDZ7_9ACTN
MASPDEDRGDFADRLNKLFDTMRHPSGREYSLKEIADGTARVGPTAVTHQHLSRLRSGASRNPGLDQVKAIANVFGVSPKYFVGEEQSAQLESEMNFLTMMRDRKLSNTFLRASRLTPEGLAVVTDLIASMEKIGQVEDRDDLPRSSGRQQAGNAASAGENADDPTD